MSISKELFLEAKKIVLSTNNFSPAYLQRKLAIGYNRAVVLQEMIKRSRYLKEGHRYRRFVSKKRKTIFK
jgi:DNA segregation ATPase FtsK/SpoIIIE-like protein